MDSGPSTSPYHLLVRIVSYVPARIEYSNVPAWKMYAMTNPLSPDVITISSRDAKNNECVTLNVISSVVCNLYTFTIKA